MGGGSKKQTVGYRYFLGMHMVLCHGPVDAIREILIDGNMAWDGNAKYREIDAITINKPALFGGDDGEGGVAGYVDVLWGGPNQTPNNYLNETAGRNALAIPSGGALIALLTQLGVFDEQLGYTAAADQIGVPAFRGVTSLVLKQMYLGNSPYIKPWSVRMQRVFKTSGGTDMWYKEKAPIGRIFSENQAFWFALDYSGSLNATIAANGNTLWSNLQNAMYGGLDYLNEQRKLSSGVKVDVALRLWAAGADHTATWFDVDDAAIEDIKAWLGAYTNAVGTGTAMNYGFSGADSFFGSASSSPDTVKNIIFVTDGEPNPPSSPTTAVSVIEAYTIPDINIYAINIELEDTTAIELFDNTPFDGTPVIPGDDPSAIQAAIKYNLSGQIDLNPAHIIYECLTDAYWGMGYQAADIDDTSFMAAADQLFNENFGLSMLWDRSVTIDEFIGEIIRHIDATLYIDRTTGKFVLKLIRDDYYDDDLITLGEDDITKVDEYRRPSIDELTNSVTVVFEDWETAEDATASDQDIALVSAQGTVVGTTQKYPGISNHQLAQRVASRDLAAMSNPVLSCTIYATRKAANLNIGDVFKFEWPDLHAGYLVMRATGMAFGDGRNNQVKLTCVEDIFSISDDTASFAANLEIVVSTQQEPANTEHRIIVEAPYYELVQEAGAAQVALELDEEPDTGVFIATAGKPNYALNALLYVDSGGGYEETTTIVDFCPIAILSADVDHMDTTIPITGGIDLSDIIIGSHAQIGDELVRVDAVTSTELTVGRGILDTVPRPHLTNEVVFFWDYYVAGDGVGYVAGESVDVKLLAQNEYGAIELASSVAQEITFDSRAIRPFPPGNLKFNDKYFPESVAGDVVLIWSHRDRLQQTSGTFYDFTDGNIGPEAGTTYTIRVYDVDGGDVLLRTATGETETNWTYTAAFEVADGGPFVNLRFEIEAMRDGYSSYQLHDHTIARIGYGRAYGQFYGGI